MKFKLRAVSVVSIQTTSRVRLCFEGNQEFEPVLDVFQNFRLCALRVSYKYLTISIFTACTLADISKERFLKPFQCF